MDAAHRWTDKKIKKLEKDITREFQIAIDEAEETTRDYFKRFETKDKKWRSWVKQGVKTEKEYQEWRFGQMCVGDRWEELKDNLSDQYRHANDIAKEYARDMQLHVYAENFNYSTYDIEKKTKINTNFNLYDKNSVLNILANDPDVLPQPGKKTSSLIAAGLEKQWNKQLVQSAVIQGVLQGLTIPKLATKLAENVGDKNRKAAIRNARTMMTGAQNAGRVDSYKRAQRMGIDLKQEWVAILDGRTRHEHRLLDGQRVNVGEPFEVEGMTIRFPGDPQAAPRMVYNCRCTLISQLKGFEIDTQRYRQDADLDGMTYAEWKQAKKAKSNSILLPEEKAKNIKGSYINRYRSADNESDYAPGALGRLFDKDSMQKSLDVNYNEYKDLISNSPNKTLFEKFAHKANYEYSDQAHTKYFKNTIYWHYVDSDTKSKWSVLAHENGHWFDFCIGDKISDASWNEINTINKFCGKGSENILARASLTDEFLTALRSDMDNLKDGAIEGSLIKELIEKDDNGVPTGTIQDVLRGFFNVNVQYRHPDYIYEGLYNNYEKDKQAYNLRKAYKELGFDIQLQEDCKNISRQYVSAREAWAGISGAITVGGEELEAIMQYLPNSSRAYERIIQRLK